MGSGHFLVEAVDFITDRLLTFLNQFPINPVNFMLDRTRRNILESLGEQGVTVDPDKLTDVNLLKRHVLKRCIYGVDLNPMAVELAKVSLWLDAFTIGAPLSFLDHHLRCGNSLIGATFKDLEAATKGQLFGIDYEPLLRAIRHVIQVNKMADATAAEVEAVGRRVRRRRGETSRATRSCSTCWWRSISECPMPRKCSAWGPTWTYSNREQFAASVAALGVGDVEKRKREKKKELSPTLVADVEALARRPDLRFFHWEIEFPEVFFGFEDAEQRRLKHKNRIAEGAAGFDVVVGNPPYVRMELIKPLKSFLRHSYECHSDRADLFIYFYERAIRSLKAYGSSAFIASSNWTKTTAGSHLRKFLCAETSLMVYLDLTDAHVFDDASTYPCVLVLRKARPSSDQVVESATITNPPDHDFANLASTIAIKFPQKDLSSGPWTFEDSKVAHLERNCKPQANDWSISTVLRSMA